jgi:hypothetical protein
MTQAWINVAFYIGVIIARFPRIKERWTAPLLRGPDWFFDVAVPPDFLKGPGAALLHNYRRRLFIPWGIEGAILLALWALGRINGLSIAALILVITLFTRFNYYAARIATENRARAFERPEAIQPASNVALSLEPRTLWNYTDWWAEAAIALFWAQQPDGWLSTPPPIQSCRGSSSDFLSSAFIFRWDCC